MSTNDFMIVTIDGPAGAGKSSVAKKLADSLGFDFLDTGAMYRCITLECIERGADLADETRVAAIANDCSIRFDRAHVYLNERDVTTQIRENHISQRISPVANNPWVRDRLVSLQKEWGIGRNGVTEGRDQGTVVFSNSPCKIFLTATPEERARRRVQQIQRGGKSADYDSILSEILARDENDMTRKVGRLVPAPDAIHVSTDGKSEECVLQELIEVVQKRNRELRNAWDSECEAGH